MNKTQQMLEIKASAIQMACENIDVALDLTKRIDDKCIYDQTLYEISKLIMTNHEDISIQLINKLENKYFYGYRAFKYVLKKDENEIDHLILLLNGMIQTQPTNQEYIYILLEIGLSIVGSYPHKALRIFETVDQSYEIFNCLPAEILDLSVEIVLAFAKYECIEFALNHIDIIEVDYYKEEALKKLLALSESNQDIEKINFIKSKLESLVLDTNC